MGLLGRIFGLDKKLIDPADISKLEVDIHSHLIPGIDDGSQNMEDSIALVKKFKELGYRKIITTPHVMSDYYRNTPETILGGLQDLKNVLKTENIDMEIEAAAEYYLDDVFEELLEKDKVLTFGKQNFLLFELPFIAEPANLNRAIFNMQLKGIKPVLAHPERYSYWFRDLHRFEELHEKGVMLQVNVNSLSGYYGPESQKVADYLVEKALVGLLGSDCHRLEHLTIYDELTSRTPAFHKVLECESLLNARL